MEMTRRSNRRRTTFLIRYDRLFVGHVFRVAVVGVLLLAEKRRSIARNGLGRRGL